MRASYQVLPLLPCASHDLEWSLLAACQTSLCAMRQHPIAVLSGRRSTGKQLRVLHASWACAADADETRLRELCSDLLGPVRSSGDGATETSDQWQPQVSHPDCASRACLTAKVASRDAASSTCGPQVLGLDKRKLLREEVLRDISRNRSNQRLVNEFAEMLDELGIPVGLS